MADNQSLLLEIAPVGVYLWSTLP